MPAREETYQKVMTALQKLACKGAAITVKAVAHSLTWLLRPRFPLTCPPLLLWP
jgi:hypothetical protein